MISRDEIEAKASEFDIHVANVERDYVFGWLLAGVYSGSDLGDLLLLKGGNAFRKAYFPMTRFSNDLDFSTEREVNPAEIVTQVNKVCEFVRSRTEIEFDLSRTRFDTKALSDNERRIYEGRVYFRDFYGNPDAITISVRFDITEMDRIYLPVQQRRLIHPYSDRGQCADIFLRCIKLEEMLATKLKCLLQRRHLADLYDLVHALFVNRELDINRSEVVSAFFAKTIFRGRPRSAAELLLGLPLETFRSFWDKYIACPPAVRFALDEAIGWFGQLVREFFGELAPAYRSAPFFPSRLRNPIMEAGSGMHLMAVVYDGVRRIVEPYSLVFKRRRDGVEQEYFYVYDRTGGRSGPGIKALLHNKLRSIEVLRESFEPRFPVELGKAGERFGPLEFSGRPGSRIRRARSFRWRPSAGPSVIYVVQCPYCSRQFKRREWNTQLREHKDNFGNRCYGRIGHIVEQRYE